MTDGQKLFVVFAVLYAIESLRWLPVRCWLCAGHGPHWRLRQPAQQVQFHGLALAALPLLPPVDVHLVTLPWPLIPLAEGVAIQDSGDLGVAVVPWHELKLRVENATLFLTDVHSVRLPGPGEAHAALERVASWRPLNHEAREADFLALAKASLDPDAARHIASQLSHQTRWLRWLSLAIFVWCFGVIAAVYRWLGDSLEVLIAAGVLLLLQGTQAALFWRAASGEIATVKLRFWKMLGVACLPQIAMRAPDIVSKAVAATVHPLALKLLIDEASWLKLARHFWRHARYDSGATRPLLLRALAPFFEEHKVEVNQLEPAPEKQAGSASYCPRCLAQFRQDATVCADCGDLPLKQWPA